MMQFYTHIGYTRYTDALGFFLLSFILLVLKKKSFLASYQLHLNVLQKTKF